MQRRTFLTLTATLLLGGSRLVMAQTALSLEFDPQGYVEQEVEVDGRVVRYRFWKAIPYVANPVDVAYQSLNISVPVAIDGVAVDAVGAPVLLANKVGGYMPSSVVEATGIDEGGMMAPPAGADGPQGEAPSGTAIMQDRGERVSNAKLALAAGLVVVEPGARGRSLVDAAGTYYGTAPAAIVDLKAAVRWLRHNRATFPGDVGRIVSSGTSAGGALSALLGASGDDMAYEPWLAALGAAPESDAIHAAGCWCPITDLDHADMAYEWNWGGNPLSDGAISDPALSAELAAMFSDYQAGLGLSVAGTALTADALGPHMVDTWLRPAATAHLAALPEADRATYLADNPHIGWDGSAASFDWPAFLSHVGARKKEVPAFDAPDLSTGENNLFGGGTVEARHFTGFMAARTGATLDADVVQVVPLMNPMTHLLAGNPGRARNWWLRVGAKDTDTALSVVANLDAAARALGDRVDTAIYWDAGHGANEDAAAFVAWIATL